jgi:uncharacterized protein
MEDHMTTEENKRLMQRVFDELSRGNSPALIEVLADDVEWHITGTTKFSRTYRGKATVMNDLIVPLFSQLADQFVMTADRFIAGDNFVVVEARGKATTKTGRPYNNKYCWVFRLEDGKVKEVTEYMDTQLVVTTFES